MRNFARFILASSIMPALILIIFSVIYFLKWSTPNITYPSHGRYSGMAHFMSFTWPYFIAAFFCSQLTWRFFLKDPKLPNAILLINFVFILLGFLYVLIGADQLLSAF